MSLSKSDFLEWKNHPVTEAIFEEIHQRITEARDILEKSAGLDQISDNFWRGFLQAYREILDVSVEDKE